MDTSPLVVSDLHKSYGDFPVLRGLDLQVEPGAVMGLVGLNGSGKTTTIECLLGLQGFNSGSIRLFDVAPANLSSLQGDVVAIFDSPSLYNNLTLGQCLQHARLLCSNPVRSVQEVESLLSIEQFHDFRVRQLSLGNKRRASIAQALLGQPRFVLLDEPFNGLDAEGVDDVLALITRLNREQHTSFLLSSHQLPYLEQVCSHISILSEGRIARSGKLDELLSGEAVTASISATDSAAAAAALGSIDGIAIVGQRSGGIDVALNGIDSATVNRRSMR